MASPTDGHEIDWNRGEHSGLVSAGSHRLLLSVSGPDRNPGQPVVVIMHGLTSTMSEWPVARRMISSIARTVDYDRAGYGLSDESPDPPSAVTIARELNAVLKAAKIDSPYITVGHSWGGVLTMEFMDLRPGEIAGMVFVDAGVPHYFDVVPMSFKEPAMIAVNKDLDYLAVTGLKEASVLSPEEWQALTEEENSEKHGRQAQLEFGIFFSTFADLKEKGLLDKQPPILGDRPVCVVKGHLERDMEKMYEAGVQAGNGTEDERARYRAFLETWEQKEVAVQKDFFKLSTKGLFLEAEQCGHNVHLSEPHVIVEAVKWTLENLSK
jgi:pimeloyl-ACP methyl ester carboxylesterase